MGEVVYLSDYRPDKTTELAALADSAPARAALREGLGMLGRHGWPQPGADDDFRTTLMHSLAAMGPLKVVEGYALGRFYDFADQTPRPDAAELSHRLSALFGPLFRDLDDPAIPRLEVGALQEALNDLGGSQFDDWQELPLDEEITSAAAQAFARVVERLGARTLTEALGYHLGFL